MASGIEFQVKNLTAMRRALDQHNERCPEPARAFLLNPVDQGVLGWSELWGLPVHPDERVPVKRFRIDCPGSAANIEHELADYLETEEQSAQERAGLGREGGEGAAGS